jgi:epoxyqueuosine reductase QueG
MKEAIRQRAFELGFDDCRFTTAAPPHSAAQLQSWLGAKRHGEMTWIERNAPKRMEPKLVLPNSRSVICLAISYHNENPKSEIRNLVSSPATRNSPITTTSWPTNSKPSPRLWINSHPALVRSGMWTPDRFSSAISPSAPALDSMASTPI